VPLGAVEVEEHVARRSASFALREIAAQHYVGEHPTAGFIGGVVEAREGGLAGQRAAVVTTELQQRIVTQRGRVILIGIATGHLEDALAHQRLHRVAHRTATPVGNRFRHGRTQAKLVVGFGQPEQAAVAGHVVEIEACCDRSGWTRKGDRRCGRLTHDDTSLDEFDLAPFLIPERCLPVTL
jgi:hypothetical protein